MANTKLTVARAFFFLGCAVACSSTEPSSPAPAPAAEEVGKVRSAVFTNGGFESGTNNTAPPNWTVTPLLNVTGVTLQTPQTRAGLNLTAGTDSRTVTLVAVAGPETQTDPNLGAAASLRWPKFGNAVAIVNRVGEDEKANSLLQRMTISSADIDSLDGLAHVRFALAPVLEDPSHTASEQPYFFVQLRNLTQNTTLYQDFNFANQPGVPWKTQGAMKYTDWALVDIAPGATRLALGDQVELEIIAAGCSLGGHWGQVYVDGAGSTVPGLFVAGTAPSAANQNTDLTYTLTYENNGTAGAGVVVVDFNTPVGTTYQSINAPGLVCSTPAANATGLVSCLVGTVPVGGSGTFTVTTRINNGTAGNTIVAGNYSIRALNVSPLLGPKVFTTVTNAVNYADLRVAITSPATTAATGSTVSYSVVVTNAGPSAVTGATIANPVPAQLQNASWTCAGASGATCPAASGTGAINQTANIPANGRLTYTFTATVRTTAAAGQLANTATVTTPASATDPTTNNNAATNYKQITVANGVACAGNANCTSGVCHTDGLCGRPTGAGPCTVANGGTICRPGACSQNGLCIAPGSCNVDGDCSGGNWCNITTHVCTAKLPNNTAIPNDPPHTNPTLNGQCSTPAGTLVCVSGVCDVTDDRCGYPNGVGPCTTGNAGTVCRSGACSQNGQCRPQGGCNVDSDCSAAQWCNITARTCVAKLPNNSAVPSDPPHTNPTLNGQCTTAAGTLTCSSGVCDVTDDRCGLPNGVGPCTAQNGGTVCRSGACSSNGTCRAPTGCNVDSDCAATQWCNITAHICAAKLANDIAVPNDPPHTNPTLNGQCSAAAGTLVCISGVCDVTDDKCGLPNGVGPCTPQNGGTVCRSGACSSNNTCRPSTGCNVDSDCSGGNWCNISSRTCTAKLPNNTALPTDTGHTSPVLNGQCTTAAATLTCASGVCDVNDDKCGLPDGVGPCTTQNGGTVCRSGSCSSAGTCKPTTGCNTDGDCAANEWCNISAHVCTVKLPNNTAIPNDPPHTNPTLNGQCTPDSGLLTCASAVCDADDDKCGLPDGKGPCTTSNGAVICRSGTCGSNGVCQATNGCSSDAECNRETQFCHTGTRTCTAKLPNGTAVPSVPNHTPVLDGQCTAEVGGVVCIAGACDPGDDKCGLPNNAGPCTAQNGTAVCRSGACNAQDGKCGLPDGVGPCANDGSCRSNHCDSTTKQCGSACKADNECAANEFCQVSDGRCLVKRPEGDRCTGNNQCASDACNGDVCDTLFAAGSGFGCSAAPSSSHAPPTVELVFGLSFVVAGLVRRRRRSVRLP